MRPWAERVDGIPPEQVSGSSGKTKFEIRDGQPVSSKLPELSSSADKAGKPAASQHYIGRRPPMALDHSDSELQMPQWTGAGRVPRFCLYVHHTDAERESHIGKLNKSLDEAKAKGWTVVSRMSDWAELFSLKKP